MIGNITNKLTTGPLVNTQGLLTWTNRSLELLWLLTVFLVPLAFVSRGDLLSASAIAYLEVPKMAVLRTLVSLMAVLWLIEWGVQGRPSRPSFLSGKPSSNPMWWLFLAVALYLASVLLSTALSTSLGVSLWGEVPGEDGYAAYTIISYIVLFAVVSTHLKTRPQMWRLLGAIIFTGILASVFSMMQNYGYDPFDLRYPPNLDRSTSTMGSPILAGAVMLMVIPITLVTAIITLQRKLATRAFWALLVIWTLVLTMQIIGITFMQGRGAWVGTMAALAGFMGLVYLFMGWRTLLRGAMLLMLSIALTAAVVAVSSIKQEDVAVVAETEVSSGSSDSDILTDVADTNIDQTGVQPVIGNVAMDRLTSITGQVASGGISGRLDIWKDSWRLMVYNPWFESYDLTLRVLRPVIGYGPDLFRYVYMLESPIHGPDQIPRESVHAHNFFLHQGVEAGFLGLLTAAGIFIVPLGLGLYLLVSHRRTYTGAQKLVLIGLVAALAGRLLEQMVGIARVSDLTMFWVLLAALAAMPVVIRVQDYPGSGSIISPDTSLTHSDPVPGSYKRLKIWQMLVIGTMVGGIGVLTWVKTINYPVAALNVAKGVEQVLAGNFQPALTSLDRAINLAPDVWINYDRRAMIYSKYLESGQASRGLECTLPEYHATYDICLSRQAHRNYLEGAEQRPLNFRSQNAMATSLLGLSKLTNDRVSWELTIESFQDVIALVPKAWPLYNRLGATYLGAGQPQAALGVLEKALAITGYTSNSVSTHMLQGVAYREMSQPLAAIEKFGKAIELEPTNIEAYNNRAMIYWGVDQHQRAVQDLDQIEKLAKEQSWTVQQFPSKYAEGYSNRGLIALELGRPQEAIEDLNRAIALDPELAAAYNNRGLAYTDLMEYRKAIEDYNHAIELDPEHVQAYVNRGVAYNATGRPEKAVMDADQAVALDPWYANAFALRALAYVLLGNDAEVVLNQDIAVELGFHRYVLEEMIQELRGGS